MNNIGTSKKPALKEDMTHTLSTSLTSKEKDIRYVSGSDPFKTYPTVPGLRAMLQLHSPTGHCAGLRDVREVRD